MKITIIAAQSKDGVIAVRDEIPWKSQLEFAHFKKTTWGKPIIMGRKTFDSIGRVLPGRTNVVISRSLRPSAGIAVYRSLEEALKAFETSHEVFIIGGGQIYEQAMSYAHNIILTEMDYTADDWVDTTYFPAVMACDWSLISEERFFDPNATPRPMNFVIQVYKVNALRRRKPIEIPKTNQVESKTSLAQWSDKEL